MAEILDEIAGGDRAAVAGPARLHDHAEGPGRYGKQVLVRDVPVNDLGKRQVAVIYRKADVVAFMEALALGRSANVGQQTLAHRLPERGAGGPAVELPGPLNSMTTLL